MIRRMNPTKLFCLFLVLGTCVQVSVCALGVDVFDTINSTAFSCLKSNGYSFAVVRCWQNLVNVGRPDPNCVSSIQSAWAGGLQNVDVYLFPCFECGYPKAQVSTMVDWLTYNNLTYTTVWLHVEGPGTYWGSNQANNSAFFDDLLEECYEWGLTLGVYSSAPNWNAIFGEKYTAAKTDLLWYANNNGEQNFNDFTPFGGWTKPAVKQYTNSTSVCGVHAGLNFSQ